MTIKKLTAQLQKSLTPQEIEAARKDADVARVQQALAKEIKPQQP